MSPSTGPHDPFSQTFEDMQQLHLEAEEAEEKNTSGHLKNSTHIYRMTDLNLARHETRLLTLQPGTFADHIRCSLTRVSLDECPEYEALSYTWG
jgi:hypothetical protein